MYAISANRLPQNSTKWTVKKAFAKYGFVDSSGKKPCIIFFALFGSFFPEIHLFPLPVFSSQLRIKQVNGNLPSVCVLSFK